MWKVAAAIVLGILTIPVAAWAAHSFTDVPDDAFYADPVAWAVDNGLTTGCNGTGGGALGTEFCPDDPVTRGENITFSFRYGQNVLQPALGEVDEAIAELREGPQTNRVINSRSFSSGFITGFMKIACAEGETITGGGHRIPDDDLTVMWSYPEVTPSGIEQWSLGIRNETGRSHDVGGYALCVAY